MAHCYLLRSTSTTGRAYVGFTVDPSKRLLRHNGILTGGAKDTKRHRPWEYVAIVSGFADENAAKHFEYAWQHPRAPWRPMAGRLRRRGLIGAAASSAVLRRLTAGLVMDSDRVAWKLRVLAVMLGMDEWRGLRVQFDAGADKARARVRSGAPQPLAIELSLVQAFPVAAAGRALVTQPVGQAEQAAAAAAAQGGKMRGSSALAQGAAGAKKPRLFDVIVVDDDDVIVVE
jgi:predicted GIY-YIG superfamily endonuclease